MKSSWDCFRNNSVRSMCSKILLISLSFFGILTVVCARPGYNSLSQAIMNSMTDLWNEKQAVNTLPSEEQVDDWWDLLDDSESENESSDEKTSVSVSYEPLPVEKSSYVVQNAEVKSEYLQLPKKKKPTIRKPLSRNPPVNRNIFIKSSRAGPSPLFRALYNSNPISFEELLHYYDYLDYSYEDSCEDKDTKNTSKTKKPQFTDTIESMLTKFVSTMTGLIERPVVVQANVCCSNPSVPLGGDKPDLLAANNPTEPPLKLPPYISNASLPDRYASNQEDIVKQLKDQHDKIVRLMETVGQIKKGIPKEPVEETKPDVALVAMPGEKSVMINSDSQTTNPFVQLSTSIDSSEAPVTASPITHSEVPVELSEDRIESTTTPQIPETTPISTINPKDAVETLPVGEVIPEIVTDLPARPGSETTVKVEVSDVTETLPPTEENTIASSTELAEIQTTSKRKRRNAHAKSRTKQEKVSVETKAEILPTTLSPNVQDLDYDVLTRDVSGSKTLALDTMVLNDIPIVEHIHDTLLDREKKSPAGEWKPNRSVKGCETKLGIMSPGDEKIIAEPPDFLELLEK